MEVNKERKKNHIDYYLCVFRRDLRSVVFSTVSILLMSSMMKIYCR